MTTRMWAALALVAALLAGAGAWAQEEGGGKPPAGNGGAAQPAESGEAEEEEDSGPKIAWTAGPAKADVGALAEIEFGQGYRWAGPDDTRRILEAYGNPTSGKELALIFAPPGSDWFAVFEFDEVGFVKDDEKDKLDADALLESIRKGNEQGNEMRRQRGWGELAIVGWEVKPTYNQESNNLEWAVRCRSKSGDSVNYNVRILGRAGVMEATLVVDPDNLAQGLPAFRKLLAGFAYKSGSKYAEYRSGDKLAAVGLAALVAGGAAAAAAKSGLLGKLLKPLLLGLLAVGAFFKNIVGRLFGRKTLDPNNPPSTPPVS